MIYVVASTHRRNMSEKHCTYYANFIEKIVGHRPLKGYMLLGKIPIFAFYLRLLSWLYRDTRAVGEVFGHVTSCLLGTTLRLEFENVSRAVS